MQQVLAEPQAASHIIDAARKQANQAAERARVVITELSTPEQSAAAADLLDAIWNKEGKGTSPVEPGLLVALEHAGNHIVGAYQDQQMVGAAIGFFGPPATAMMHSHIAGVSASSAGRGVGAAMKLHQRLWCLERGVTTLEWTFDPLILRNAGFNLNRLEARLEEYLPQFYGQMRDATNAGQGSDRALVRWHLVQQQAPTMKPAWDQRLIALCLDVGDDDAPVLRSVPEDGLIGLRIPADIESMRITHPELSAQWRTALRETMHPLMGAGWTVGGFSSDGTYVLHR